MVILLKLFKVQTHNDFFFLFGLSTSIKFNSEATRKPKRKKGKTNFTPFLILYVAKEVDERKVFAIFIIYPNPCIILILIKL